MKINRFVLIDFDKTNLTFSRHFKGKDYTVAILAAEIEPQVIVKENQSVVVSERLRSVDDLKIFLEERLYQHLDEEN